MAGNVRKWADLSTLVGCVVLLGGCATRPRFHVSVSALAASEADSARRYVLLPGNKDVKLQDLQFQEYATYLRRALDWQGFSEANDDQDADVVIVALYSISDPQEHTYTYAIPHWGQTGYQSATTYGTLYKYGNYGTYSGTTYYQPSYGITGYSAGVGTYVTYTRTLGLVGFDAQSIRAGEEPKELWRVFAVSVGSSSDLRMIFPYLVAAARPYIGKATEGRAVEFTFKEDDERVAEVRTAVVKENRAHE